MSCCPSVKCRNTGSGYVKPSGRENQMAELLAARMAERTAQDTVITKMAQSVAHPMKQPSDVPETKYADKSYSIHTSQASGIHSMSYPRIA